MHDFRQQLHPQCQAATAAAKAAAAAAEAAATAAAVAVATAAAAAAADCSSSCIHYQTYLPACVDLDQLQVCRIFGTGSSKAEYRLLFLVL